MSDDSALERIKRRQQQRPQVPERGSPYEVNNSLEPETIEVTKATIPTQKDTRKGGSLRLDATVSKTIRHICVDAEVTRETLIEALIEFYQKHPEAQPEILASARAKQNKRMEAANLKRRQAMLERLQS
ncbi:MAG: hypothetical protein M3O33_10075 [Cyanobacteriota bacterium]|nr:hypothetical protein [Cyanobacteriota bacterium]